MASITDKYLTLAGDFDFDNAIFNIERAHNFKTIPNILTPNDAEPLMCPPQISSPPKSPRKQIEAVPFDKIHRVGFEVEGAWVTMRNDLHDDASFSRHDFPHYLSVGEYVSEPFDNPQDLFANIYDNWPEGKCAKCGYHIHVSLKDVFLYSALMNEKFYEYFLLCMEKWANTYPCKSKEFWSRLHGEVKYCKKQFIPDYQVTFKEKGVNRESRRTQLHYCYGQTQTLENRLFPVFQDAETAISATKAFLNCVEIYLSENPTQEKNVSECVSTETPDKQTDRLKISNFNLFDLDMDMKKRVGQVLKKGCVFKERVLTEEEI